MHLVEYHSPSLNSTLLAFARQQVTPAYERTVGRGWWWWWGGGVVVVVVGGGVVG